MSNSILVTGVSGNVGQFLAQELSSEGFDVVGVYRKHVPENVSYRTIQADLAKDDLHIDGIETVIHCAALLHGNAKQLLQNNVEATRRILEWAEMTGVRRIMYMSTVSVYGAAEGEISESSVVRAPDAYGMTKGFCEFLVKESAIPDKVVLQLPRMLGPFVDVDKTIGSGFITMTKKLLDNDDITCFIPYVPYNNYMHVSDLAQFVLTLLKKKSWHDAEKVVLGARDKLDMLKILQIMKDEMKSTSNLIIGQATKPPRCAKVNIEKAISLGYRPQNAEQVLRRFAAEMLEKRES